MITERTRPIALPLSMSEVEDHLRLTWAVEEQQTLQAMITAATYEIEERAGLAILAQTVTVTTEAEADLPLPVGPVAMNATATLSTLGDDGTLTAVGSGFWIEGGRWPTLHITDPTITGRVRITYPAGPVQDQDVRHAICDQVGLHYDHRGEPAKASALSASAAALVARRGKVRI